jgi:hypothetical protein
VTTKLTNEQLLDRLASQWGQPSEVMIEGAIYDAAVPGICTKCEDYSTEVEPDCRKGWCEVCGTKTVKSCLVLAGLI